MAGGEGERIGGVYVDVGIDDEGVLARLDQIATALSNLAKRETVIKVKTVEEGSTTSSRAGTKSKPIELNTTLKLEANAAKKAVKGITAEVPVTLTLKPQAINKLKAQINEAFQNFSIKVNVEYSGQSSGNFSPSMAQEEFAEATGLGGHGPARTKRITRSSGPAAGPAPAYDRFYAVAKNSATLDELKQTRRTAQADPKAGDQIVNKFTGAINQLERRLRVLSAAPAGSLPEEQPQAVERPLVERVRRVQKRSALSPKRIIPRPITAAVVQTEYESTGPAPDTHQFAYVPPPTSTPTGRRRMQAQNNDPQLEAIYQAQRRADREAALLSGRGSGEAGGSKFTPRGRQDREFDRTGLGRMPGDEPRYAIGPQTSVEGVRAGDDLVIRGPISRNQYGRAIPRGARRRAGPRRNFEGPDPSRRFLEPFAQNQVKQVVDENSLGFLDPAAFQILNEFRLGKYGTKEEPKVEELSREGLRVGEISDITSPQRRKALKDAGTTAFGTTFSSGRYRIVNPKTIAKERLAAMGHQLTPRVQELLFGTQAEVGTQPERQRSGLLNDPKFRPGAGMFGQPGYIGTSSGAGGAARSALDTPEGNAANRARIEYSRYIDALHTAEEDNPEFGAAVRANTATGLGYRVPKIRMAAVPTPYAYPVPKRISEPRRAMLEPFLAQTGGDVAETKALMKASPREFGFNSRLEQAFGRYRSGYSGRAGVQGYLGEDDQVTPASTYRAQVRKIIDQFKEEFQYGPRKKLPEPMLAQLAAYNNTIKEDTGFTVPDYDKFIATGGRGQRRIAGRFEEAAARAEPSGRATTTAREPRRSYTPAEEQVAELRSMLERLEGTPESIKTAVRPGRAGTAEEQRLARQGGATRFTPKRLGEVDVARYHLRMEQAREAGKEGDVTRLGSVLSGTTDLSNATGVRDTQEYLRGLGLEAGGVGLPRGVMGGVSVRSPGSVQAARDALAAALQKQRGIRRMLQPSYAAAGAERQELVERGVKLDQGPILSDKTPLSGDELAAKVAASPTLGREVRPARTEVLPPAGTDTGNVRQALLRRLAGGLGAYAATRPTPAANVVDMAAWARVNKAESESVIPLPAPAIRQIPLAEEPKPAAGDTEAWTAMIRRRAAEKVEPALGGAAGGGGDGTGGPLTASGGIVQVDIVRSIPLQFVGGGGPGGGGPATKTAKLKEDYEDIDPDKIRAEAAKARAKKPDMADEDLAKILTKRGYEKSAVYDTLGIAAATPSNRAKTLRSTMLEAENAVPGLSYERDERSKNYKSDARIAGEADILAARALNPTRAFQTAVAAGFAKTIGGGGKFEIRVRELTRAREIQTDLEEALEKINKSLSTNAANLEKTTAKAAELELSPASPGKAQQLEKLATVETSLTARRNELEGRRAELEPQVASAQQETAQRRRNLISPLGVARGFTALAGGAIVGGLIFGAASQAVQAAIGLLEKQASIAADALSGFALTASKVTGELAGAVRSSFGDTRGAVAGAAAPSGISAAALSTLNQQGLGGRAESTAAAQARVQESDLFRSSNFLSSDRLPGGYDRGLFEGTGGILNSSILAPQPGFMERIVGDLNSFSASTPTKTKDDYGPLQGLFDAARNVNPLATQIVPTQTEVDTRTKTYVADLNEQLARANSGFKYLTKSTPELAQAMQKSADRIGKGDVARDLISKGLVITGQGGRALQGTEFGQQAADLARGQLIVSPEVAQQQDQRGIQAQVNQLARQREHELNFSLPTQLSLENLAAPATPPGTGIIPNGNETKAVSQGIAEAAQLQGQLNQRYEQGNAILKQILPADLLQSIESTGKQITAIQTSISNQSATLQTHEYNNQLRIAQRTLSDISGLTGKNYGYGKSQLGVIERQNFELGKQSTLLSQQMAQRQINFQVAAAGFQSPGLSSEERKARVEEAKLEASYAQKQLDIQKKQTGNQFKLFDLQNVRAATDALASIGLLKEGRSVAINTKVAEEKLQRLNKLQADNVKKAGKYLQEVEGQASIAMSEITKLETAYGNAIHGITMDTIDGFNKYIKSLYSSITQAINPQGGVGTEPYGPPTPPKPHKAMGFLGTVSGASDMTVGEAGAETVAILRHPRSVSPTGGMGGGGITININHPVVKEANDINKIVKAVQQSLQRQFALTTPRRA